MESIKKADYLFGDFAARRLPIRVNKPLQNGSDALGTSEGMAGHMKSGHHLGTYLNSFGHGTHN